MSHLARMQTKPYFTVVSQDSKTRLLDKKPLQAIINVGVYNWR